MTQSNGDIVGDWDLLSRKTALLRDVNNNVKFGYCRTDSQCLIDPDIVDPDLRCIDSGSPYESADSDITDNFCENGKWTSRTKEVAALLIGYARSDDFALSCNTKDKVLNNFVKGVEGDINNFGGELTTNNVCVLKTRGEIILGLTINKDLSEIDANEQSSNLKKAFGVRCNNDVGTEDSFQLCDDNKLWYNPKLKALI